MPHTIYTIHKIAKYILDFAKVAKFRTNLVTLVFDTDADVNREIQTKISSRHTQHTDIRVSSLSVTRFLRNFATLAIFIYNLFGKLLTLLFRFCKWL